MSDPTKATTKAKLSRLGKVYAISSGSYSDYKVLAVTEDKKTAEAWAAALRSDPDGWCSDAEVEELTYIPTGLGSFTVTTYRASVTLWDDGKEESPYCDACTENAISVLNGPPPSRPAVRRVRAPIHRDKGGRIDITAKSAAERDHCLGEQLTLWRAALDKRAYWSGGTGGAK